MTDRQLDGLVASFLKSCHRLFDRFTRATNHPLPVAVDVGNDHVAIDGFQHSFDLLNRRKHRRHFAVVVHRHSSHPAAACTHCFQCVFKRQRARSNQRPYSPRLCPIVISGAIP